MNSSSVCNRSHQQLHVDEPRHDFEKVQESISYEELAIYPLIHCNLLNNVVLNIDSNITHDSEHERTISDF